MYPVSAPTSDLHQPGRQQICGHEHPGETEQNEEIEGHLSRVSQRTSQRSVNAIRLGLEGA
jgi:hypothetical protein